MTRRAPARSPRLVMAAVLAAVTVLASGCGAVHVTSTSAFAQADSKTVRLVVNSWTGSLANVAVAQWLLEHKLGYSVRQVHIAEIPAWNALATGRADAILENWGHEDQQKIYVQHQKTVVMGGKLGAVGHIGWFVPSYLAKEHPDITSYKNLNKYADLFSTPESGSKGQLLEGSPSYVTNDQALVKNLHLNYKLVYAGSEAAEITQIRTSYEHKKPLLFYWYKPQWLNSELKFTEVKLPKRTPGCDAVPAKVDCAYPTYDLTKVFSKAFVDKGGPALQFLKNFHWNNKQQNEVSVLIAEKGMDPEQVAATWVHKHPDIWKKWLPSGS